MSRNMDNKIYLAYGSNINLEQMKRRCPTAKVIGTSNLTDYQLIFRGARKGAVATIEPSAGGSVPVLLWEITPSDEKSLDHYEGWPFLYRKESVNVELNGKIVETMAYVMNTKGRKIGKPGNGYYNTIMAGYNAVGFNPEILDKGVENSARIMLEEKLKEEEAKKNREKISWARKILSLRKLKKATNF